MIGGSWRLSSNPVLRQQILPSSVPWLELGVSLARSSCYAARNFSVEKTVLRQHEDTARPILCARIESAFTLAVFLLDRRQQLLSIFGVAKERAPRLRRTPT